MKKQLILVVMVCIIAFLAVPGTAAEKSIGKQDMKFYLNLGVLSNDTFDMFHWQGGMMMDFFLGENLVLSPEVMLTGYKFAFDYLYLYPGATLNLLLTKGENKLFVGGGVIMFVPIVPGDYDTKLELKINGGLMAGNIRLSVFFWTPFSDLFSLYTLGANIGFAL